MIDWIILSDHEAVAALTRVAQMLSWLTFAEHVAFGKD